MYIISFEKIGNFATYKIGCNSLLSEVFLRFSLACQVHNLYFESINFDFNKNEITCVLKFNMLEQFEASFNILHVTM